MRVLVTGGTGFTGKALVKRLLDDGHAVVALDYKEGLKTVEAYLHRAVALFERCRSLQSSDIDIDTYIQQCNKLIFDVHQSSTVGANP